MFALSWTTLPFRLALLSPPGLTWTSLGSGHSALGLLGDSSDLVNQHSLSSPLPGPSYTPLDNFDCLDMFVSARTLPPCALPSHLSGGSVGSPGDARCPPACPCPHCCPHHHCRSHVSVQKRRHNTHDSARCAIISACSLPHYHPHPLYRKAGAWAGLGPRLAQATARGSGFNFAKPEPYQAGPKPGLLSRAGPAHH